ncbi:hypothetical protein [Shewanella gaetbuli]|uniref:Lipoprotein n=1 Tax=Shewanella gaetbuli TaxID=220752 RepID=A0A9X1ZGK4_9GAMM|nr:hypothetical protein [Shewanella gaetbuli]MCL1141191.1 hypothetical protein [Shewanella gaetbuli]
MRKQLVTCAICLSLFACSSDDDNEEIVKGIDIDQATSINVTNFKFDTENFVGTFALENDQGERISDASNYKVMMLADGIKPSATAFDIPWHHSVLNQCGVIEGHECLGELTEVATGEYRFTAESIPQYQGNIGRIRVSMSIVGQLAETAPKLY